MARRRVVITGLGAVTPLGNTAPLSWEGIKAGSSGVGPVTRFDASTFPARIAGEVKGLDPAQVVDGREIKKMDTFSIYAISAGAEALAEAGLKEGDFEPARAGCILGVGLGGLPILERFHQAFLEGGIRKISPFLVPAMISNLAPGNVAIKFGLKGVNYCVTSACTSSTHAIGESYRMIAEGLQDVMLTGGSESTVTPIGMGGFCAMKALSTRNEEPTRASRPFDKERDGFVLGEGAGVLILESLEHAQKRGAKILGEVVGYGFSCDAYHITSPSEGGEGAIQSMRMALETANLAPEKVGYINAHGTSTPANDATESKAIKHLFGDHAKSGLAVSSTKSMTGHLLGAAGAIEAVFTTLAIRDGILPPTINLENPDPECDLDYVPNKARAKSIDYALSNSFGFGGTNGTLALAKFKN